MNVTYIQIPQPTFKWGFKRKSCHTTIYYYSSLDSLEIMGARRVQHVEQELLNLPDHLISSSVFHSWVRVSRSFVFCVVFCRLLFVILHFFFLAISLSVLLLAISLSVLLLAISLSILLRFKASDYPIGIFTPFLQELLTLREHLSSFQNLVWFVLLDL